MEIFDSEGEWDESMRWQFAALYDALGWIHYQAGREQDAENLLVKATQISKRQPGPFYHLGQLYEGRYDASIGGELDDPEARARFYELAVQRTAAGHYFQDASGNWKRK